MVKKQRKTNRWFRKNTAVKAGMAAAVFVFIVGWKIPVVLAIETLDLPEGCEKVYRTRVWLSDVYWLHVKGEKVMKCSLGYEETKAYIESSNPPWRLEHISIRPYSGMSDISIYDSQFDDEFWEMPERDDYFVIDYFRKLE